MTQYGNDSEPSIITDVTSTSDTPVSGESASEIGFVGQADLDNADNPANTSKVYQITKKKTARNRFGPENSSLLTQGIIDALNEGAYPIYAVAAAETDVTGEDISGVSSTTVSLANAPIREAESSITVTLDGSTLTTNRVYDDVSGYSPSSGECYFNPVRGKIELPSTPGDADSTNDTVDYSHFDYTGGIDVMVNEVPDVIDYLVPLSENISVADYANTQVNSMEDQYNLALALVGADIYIDKTNITNYTQRYDDSRTQTVYPTRFENGTSALAAYAGLKANLGLTETPINRRLENNKRLDWTLNRAQRGSLIDKNVVPLADEARGVRIADDPTTVSSTNTDEFNLKFGFNRKVADYIISTTRANERPFIGRLNSQTVRNTLESLIDESLADLQGSSAVISYDVKVSKTSATEATLEMYVDLVEPLRFIQNDISIGG